MDKSELLEKLKEVEVKPLQPQESKIGLVELWFSDILGFLKRFTVPIEEFEHKFDEGFGFDGSSVEGFARIYESDLLVKPDPNTLCLLPWDVDGDRIARIFCDIIDPKSNSPYQGDSRYVLKKTLQKVEEEGFEFYAGTELEFFILRLRSNLSNLLEDSASPEIIDRGGYFDAIVNEGENVAKLSTTILKQMGIPCECIHHEVACSQYEIDLRHQEALTMADSIMTAKAVVKEAARRRGLYATFMPKPIEEINGNGMHIHLSLFKGERNTFFDTEERYGLSHTGKSFLAGLMKHAEEFSSIICQWVNSYKRLVPGYEAPVHVCWGLHNRSAMARIPMYKPGKEEAARIEFRAPDPACNPYLALAVILAAGLKGVREGYELQAPAELRDEDVFRMSVEERGSRGIVTLPDSLEAAILKTEKSDLVKETLGEELFGKFIENKKREWEEYRAHVSHYELKKYLPIL